MGPDFEKTAELLGSNQIFQSPAELHGLLAGLLSGGAIKPSPTLLEQLMSLEKPMEKVIADLIMRFSSEISTQFSSEEYSFTPLLPDDDEELAIRVYALGRWCEGFAIGFGAGSNKSDSALSEETREVLGDFMKIAEIEDQQLVESNQDEADYMELVEYVRMAAFSVYQQNAGEEPPLNNDNPEDNDTLLH